MANQRISQFHLSSDRACVVEHHPQAETKFAKEQGTVVLRFEAWVADAAKQAIVDAMNAAKIGARDLHGPAGRVVSERAVESTYSTRPTLVQP